MEQSNEAERKELQRLIAHETAFAERNPAFADLAHEAIRQYRFRLARLNTKEFAV